VLKGALIFQPTNLLRFDAITQIFQLTHLFTYLLSGAACVAQYSVDNRFYRAEIISLDSDDASATASVRFVDYGSFEHVPRHR